MAYAGYDFSKGSGILNYVLDRANELPGASSDWFESAQTDIQAAYIGVLERVTAPWAKKSPPGALITTAEVTTGSITLTQGSTNGTFSSPPAVSVAGRKIWADNDQVVCRVSTHTAAAAAFTLDAAYPGSGGSGLAYHLFKDEYDLASDFLVPRSKPFLRDCAGSYKIDLVGEDEFNTQHVFSPQESGTTPALCAFIGDRTIRVAPWPREQRRLEYEYNYHPGTLAFDGGSTDAIIIKPSEDAVVVGLFAIANMLLNKDDDRAGAFAQAAAAKLEEMGSLAKKRQRPRIWVHSRHSVGARR